MTLGGAGHESDAVIGRARSVLCGGLVAWACSRGAPPEPAADRSDGVLPELQAARAATPPIVDGHLDEPLWRDAPSSGLFVRPGDGKADPRSRVNASVRVAWDDAQLYFGFTVYEAEPSSPLSPGDVDPHVWELASGVEIMLQPGDFADNREYFELQVCVQGGLWDTRFDDYNRPIAGAGAARTFGHQDWKSALVRATSRAEGRWFAELALPWSALGPVRSPAPPQPGQAWRVNFYSFREGQKDSLAWSPILGRGNFHKAERWGRLRF